VNFTILSGNVAGSSSAVFDPVNVLPYLIIPDPLFAPFSINSSTGALSISTGMAPFSPVDAEVGKLQYVLRVRLADVSTLGRDPLYTSTTYNITINILNVSGARVCVCASLQTSKPHPTSEMWLTRLLFACRVAGERGCDIPPAQRLCGSGAVCHARHARVHPAHAVRARRAARRQRHLFHRRRARGRHLWYHLQQLDGVPRAVLTSSLCCCCCFDGCVLSATSKRSLCVVLSTSRTCKLAW
jgi:hypothetical protein